MDNSIFMIRVVMELLISDLLPKKRPGNSNRAKKQKARCRHLNRRKKVGDEFKERRPPTIHPN